MLGFKHLDQGHPHRSSKEDMYTMTIEKMGAIAAIIAAIISLIVFRKELGSFLDRVKYKIRLIKYKCDGIKLFIQRSRSRAEYLDLAISIYESMVIIEDCFRKNCGILYKLASSSNQDISEKDISVYGHEVEVLNKKKEELIRKIEALRNGRWEGIAERKEGKTVVTFKEKFEDGYPFTYKKKI